MKYLDKYAYAPKAGEVAEALEEIKGNIPAEHDPEVLKLCFSAMDLTTLRTEDTPDYVRALVDKANRVSEEYPGCPAPASVCVYPNFASTVLESRKSPELHVTTVSSCFPSAQSFIEVKVLECRMAVQGGADEIDIVLALNSFLAGNEDAAYAEIAAMRSAIDEEASKLGRKVVLKVILETGLLSSLELIAEASLLAMEAGADFIKTSTGKVAVNATPEAAYVMCKCIGLYAEKTGRKVGFKAAGGISNADDAVYYYSIVAGVLGKDWLCKELFRLGVSRLGNSLLGAIEGHEVKFF